MTINTTTYNHISRQHDRHTARPASPARWLRAGLEDMIAAPVASAVLGISFTLLCAAAYAAAIALPQLTLAFLVMLLLASPYFAAAAYYVSRQRELEGAVALHACLGEVRKQALSIGLFSILTGMVAAVWIRLAGITFALYYGVLGLSAADVTRVWTAGGESTATIAFLAVASAALALTLFAIGAISLPMIADRNCNAITAIHTSLKTLRRNAATMLVWMLLLTAFIATALFSGLMLMPVVFPLLAYATWHSYRQLSE